MNGINVNLWAMRSGLEDAAYQYTTWDGLPVLSLLTFASM